MTKYFTIALISALTLLVTACHDDKPAIDSSSVAIPADTQKRYNTDHIGNIIAESAANRGWSVSKAGSGLIKARIDRKDQSVAILIRFNHATYSITADPAVASDPGLYNRYTANLRRDIDKRLSVAAYK